MRALRVAGGGDQEGDVEQDVVPATTLAQAFERAERLAFQALGKEPSLASSDAPRSGKARAHASAHAGSDSDADSDDDGGADAHARVHAAPARGGGSGGARLPPDAAALAAIAAAHRMADAAHLFSRNEDADDVPTSSLRFLLLPALRGLVLANARMPPPPPPSSSSSSAAAANPMAARQRQVAVAEAALTEFLSRVDLYGMFGSGPVAQDYRRDEEAAAHAQRAGSGSGAGPSAASSAAAAPPGGGGGGGGGVLPGPPGGDLAAARNAKMARFRRGRELERHAASLGAARRSAMASAASGGGGAGGGRGPQGGRQGEDGGPRAGGAGAGMWDEDDERGYWAARVEQAALEALEQRASLRQERALLDHALSAAGAGAGGAGGDGARSRREGQWQESRQRDREAITSRLGSIADALAAGQRRGGAAGPRVSPSAPVGGGGGMGSAAALPPSAIAALTRGAGAAVDGSDRERLRGRVFTPYHTPSTVTIEEAGEEELREAQGRERRAAEAEAARRGAARERGAYCDADAEEDDDAAVDKARAWDDWKDAHPFGYGNSQTNPCPPGQMRGAARGDGSGKGAPGGYKQY